MKPTLRYSKDWPRRSRYARRLTHNRCVGCLWRRATATHHARYHCPVRGSLKGREIPGWDIFPACDRCHGWLHRAENWIHHRQRFWVWVRLVISFQVRRVPWEWLALCAAIAGALWVAI